MMSEQKTIGDAINEKAQRAVDFYRQIERGQTFTKDPAMAFLDLENEIYIATKALETAREMVK
ncbi:MAG: hypothetical protein GY938_16960 [Ketobacter sp.]|nr:hypothetical protein [Ketobacter sp.]